MRPGVNYSNEEAITKCHSSHRPRRRNDWIRSFGYTGQSRWRSVSRRSLDCRTVAAGRWSLRVRRLRRCTRNKLKRNTLSRQIRPMIALAVGRYFQLDIRPWISFWIVSANADRKSGHLLTGLYGHFPVKMTVPNQSEGRIHWLPVNSPEGMLLVVIDFGVLWS